MCQANTFAGLSAPTEFFCTVQKLIDLAGLQNAKIILIWHQGHLHRVRVHVRGASGNSSNSGSARSRPPARKAQQTSSGGQFESLDDVAEFFKARLKESLLQCTLSFGRIKIVVIQGEFDHAWFGERIIAGERNVTRYFSKETLSAEQPVGG